MLLLSVNFRYSLEGQVGGKVVSTKTWMKGEKITSLNGRLAELDQNELSVLVREKRDFSVMMSSRLEVTT